MPNAIGFIQLLVAAAKGSKGTRIWEGRGKGDDRAQERTWMRVKRQEIQAFRAIIEAMAVKNHVCCLVALFFGCNLCRRVLKHHKLAPFTGPVARWYFKRLGSSYFQRQLAVGAWREPQRSKQKCSRKKRVRRKCADSNLCGESQSRWQSS